MFKAGQIKSIILFIALSAGNTAAMAYGIDTVRNIDINLNNLTGKKTETLNKCVDAGRASEGLRADWQQLTLVQKETGFKYIRFHGLLNEDKIISINKDHWQQEISISQKEIIFLKFTHTVSDNDS